MIRFYTRGQVSSAGQLYSLRAFSFTMRPCMVLQPRDQNQPHTFDPGINCGNCCYGLRFAVASLAMDVFEVSRNAAASLVYIRH